MAASAINLPLTTPRDYHRILSPTLAIPTDPNVSIPVGILACQRDPLLRRLQTHVVSASVSEPPEAPPGKKAKKAVLAPTLPNGPVLEVLLHDTVVFPEGGGQPTDTGLLKTDEQTTWSVVQCKRHGGHAVHYVQVPQGMDAEAASTVFSPGKEVVVELGQDGWDRRYDHMSMHTSQHVLSALLETRLNLPTLSWSLTASPQPCYVEIPRGMQSEEVAEIQNEANRLVFEGRRVHVEVQELDRTDEKPAPVLENGREIGRGLPQDYTGGVKRVVVIDGVDRNPCCGTHLPSIHNLQLFILPHSESMARSGTTSARLYFLAGPRLITHLTNSHNLITSTATILSCGIPLVPERVSQLVSERKRAEKRVDELESQLSAYIAKDMVAELRTDTDKMFARHVHRSDDTLGFLNAISSAFVAASQGASYLVVLSSSPSAQTATSITIVLVFGSDTEQVKKVGDNLKSKLGAKGGGQGKWSGKFTGVWIDSREGTVVDESLKAAFL